MNVEKDSGSANIIHLPISPTPLPLIFEFPTMDSSDQRRKIKSNRTNALRMKYITYLVTLIFAIIIFLYFSQGGGGDLYSHLSTKEGTSFSDRNYSRGNNNIDFKYNINLHDDPAKPLKISSNQKIQRTDLIPAAEATVKTSIHTSTSDKLMCPKYVVEFVINATDTKDECEGLRKMYDFACVSKSHTSDEKSPSSFFHRRLMGVLFLNWKVHYKERNQVDRQEPTHDESSVSVDFKSHRSLLEETISPVLPLDDNDEITEEIAAGALSLNADLVDIPQTIMEDETQAISGTSLPQSDKIPVEPHSSMIAAPVFETQTCCKSILQVFHELCDSDDDEGYDDKRLFVIVLVIALCGMVKSLIRHFHIRWLPEAGGCILVGVFGGLFMKFFPNMDFGFQHDLFLRLMVPPIVFEAALNIDKRAFMKMFVPIIMYAVFGTIMSTCLTAAIVFYGAPFFHTAAIPFVECLAFGALISSIDPIAVLSVLSNMGMSDKDAIYVLIFGESLLNDGVAIVLFQTLLNFMDESIVIDYEAVWLATVHFLVISFGSLLVGLTCGVAATAYFWMMKGIQTPLVEVLTFLCWAFVPYYISDGIEWSGIVSIVAAGFFMDIYVIGNRMNLTLSKDSSSPDAQNAVQSRRRSGLFAQEGFLSSKARNHIGFVTEINSTLMETAIFAYLGLFLFNKRYHWTFGLPALAVFSCIASRSIMIFLATGITNLVGKILQISTRGSSTDDCSRGILETTASKKDETYGASQSIIDIRMQLVLIFAGLRGAMSFALVETVPMFDNRTHQGSRFKPELKAMTSACIVFTVFVLGGSTYYLLERLGLGPSPKEEDTVEMVSLLTLSKENIDDGDDEEEDVWSGDSNGDGTRRRRR